MKITVNKIIRYILQVIAAVLAVVIDQLIKNQAVKTLSPGKTVTLIPHILGLTYAENTGAAFSLFDQHTWLLSVFTGIALTAGLVVMFVIKESPVIYQICLPLIIAGGAGNLYDRLTRGFVVDYIQTLFVDFPIYNFADCLITCACFAIIIYLIYDLITQSKKTGDDQGETVDD